MKLLNLIAVLVLCVCGVSFAAQIEVVHVGETGQEEIDWSDVSVWQPNVVPNNLDGSGDTYAVTVCNGEMDDEVTVLIDNDFFDEDSIYFIDRLSCYGAVDLISRHHFAGGLLGIAEPNGLKNYGELEIEQVVIIGDIVNTTEAELWYGTGLVEGNIINEAEAMMSVQGDVSFEGDYVANFGGLNIEPFAQVEVDGDLYNPSWIEIMSGFLEVDGSYGDEVDSWLSGCGLIVFEQGLDNDGMIVAQHGDLRIQSFDEPIVNTESGVFQVDTGASLHLRHFYESLDNHGVFMVGSGAVTVSSSLVNKLGGFIYVGDGSIAANEILLEEGSLMQCGGSVHANITVQAGGQLTLFGSAQLGGQLIIEEGGMVVVEDGVTLALEPVVNFGWIQMNGGRLVPRAGFDDYGMVDWAPSNYLNMADYNMDGYVNLVDFAEFADVWLWESGINDGDEG